MGMVQVITCAIPPRYYAETIFLRGSGLAVLWPQALTFAVMGVAIVTVASLRFGKRLD